MARASIPTLLSLDRYARIMGVIPPHFNQGSCGTLFMSSACSSVWFQHSWQGADSVSREDLALEIDTAENEIANVVGYYPAPKFISQDIYDYPLYHRRDLWQIDLTNVRGAPKSINLKTGKFIGPGRRAVSKIDTVTVVGGTLIYADLDGDGFEEDAEIVLPTTLTNVNLVKAYYPGKSGAQEWEIRSPRSKSISGGILTMHFYSWQLVAEEQLEAFPTTDALSAVDLTDASNLLASVDLYYEYRDTSQASVEYYWNGDAGCVNCGGSGCALCSYDKVDGCIYARNVENGIVVPKPGSYDSTTNTWTTTTLTQGRDPDFVKLWYVAGEQDQRYLRFETHEPLSDWWARVIANLATARLERPFCTCGNSHALALQLSEDLALTPEGAGTRYTTDDVINSPFGTRRGEVMAWQKVKKFTKRRMAGVTI